jgi:hypothetical protein
MMPANQEKMGGAEAESCFLQFRPMPEDGGIVCWGVIEETNPDDLAKSGHCERMREILFLSSLVEMRQPHQF